ncbi:MAG: ABC transporter permease [Terriglobia bacterium]
MSSVLQDFSYGLRTLRRNTVFTVAAIVTLGLGIGCVTAIFSAFNATVLHPLPYPSAERMVTIKASSAPMSLAWQGMSLPDALEIRAHNDVFDSVAFYGSRREVNLTGADLYARIDTLPVSPETFEVLGVRPAMGRGLRPEDAQPGKGQVAVISHSLWVQDFGSDPRVIGKTIRLNNQPYRVVGVMPSRFEFPDPFIKAWLPETLVPADITNHDLYGTPVIARLKSGITLPRAEAELNTLARRLAREYPKTDQGLEFSLVRLQDQVAAPASRLFWLLLGGVGLVLLIACANVVNLILARNATRERELAVRVALGASRSQMVRLLLAETVLLALMGGCLGLGVSVWGIDGLRLLASGSVQRLANAGIDARVLGFSFAISVMTGLLSGLAPALRATRLDLNSYLKGDLNSRSGSRRDWWRSPQSFLTIGQVALVVVLLTAAGLTLRSLSRLLDVPLGFNPRHLIGAWFAIPEGNPGETGLLAFQREVLDRVRAIPGIESVTLGSNLPFLGPVNTLFRIKKPNQGWVKSPLMEENKVSPNYFQVMGISLIHGRTFSRSDSYGATCVAALNEAGAEAMWPGENPIGKRIDLNILSSDSRYCEIVGEISNARFIKLEEPPGPEIYFPRLQKPPAQPVLMVRTAGNPLALANVILDRIAAIPGGQRVMWAFSMDQLIERSALQPRFRAVLLSLFAGLTLVIAAFGIYGVMAYFVSQRTKEIGIRMALGAQRGDVMRMVIGQGLILSIIGLAIGLACSLALVRLVSSFLFKVQPTDPVTFVAVAVLLLVVAVLASYLPARRATKIDPVVALRYE